MTDKDLVNNQRITQRDKEANDFKYYKENLDSLDGQAFGRESLYEGISEYRNMRVNYDLLANKIDMAEFDAVCKPFGENVGAMPAEMAHHDIITPKFKKIIGMEAKRPFGYTCIAVNEDATTRKEEFENSKMVEFVISIIMKPIQEQAELKYQEQLKGALTPDEKQQIQQAMSQEVEAMTPPQVKEYMARKHQDPVEALNNQLLRYLEKTLHIKDVFLKGFKHGMASGREVFMVTIVNDNPTLKAINPLYFDYGKTADSECIEDAPWAVAEFHPSASEIITQFRKKLTDDQVDRIYDYFREGNFGDSTAWENDNLWNFNDNNERSSKHIRVIYGAWKSERKIGFLTFLDDNGEEDMMMVSERYIPDYDNGDISLEWEWLPEVHHGYKICLGEDPIYIGMGAVPGQHRDLDNLHVCKLPFIGADYDDMNSSLTSFVDRLKVYQRYYDIIMWRIQLLMASDKGKILMMNVNTVPTSAGIDLKKFQYFMEANKIAYFNPNEEGNKKQLADVNSVGKVMDLSLASEIAQYIQMAEYIQRMAGRSVGVPEGAEGQISPNESVRNSQQNLVQSSDILEPYFQLHNSIKQAVLQKLIDVAKVAYSTGKPRKLTYVLDDLSQEVINMTPETMAMLDSSTVGVFVTDSTTAAQAKQMVEQLAHAAMQTSQIDLLDVVKIIRSDDIQSAEEKLQVGTERKAEQLQAAQAAQAQANAQEQEKVRQQERDKWKHERDMIILKEQERRKTEIQKQTILSLGFAEDKDQDHDGTPDVLEVAKFGVDADLKNRELNLKEKQSDRDYELGKKKLALEGHKINKAEKIAKTV